MNTLFVYADFDWFDSPQLVGELTCERVRGSETYGFTFEKEWLLHNDGISLSDDLANFIGRQYTQPGKDIFSCFSDALPDRWGRTLLNRREQIAAADEKRTVRRLTSFDYLTGVDDCSRMGAFRFSLVKDGAFINSEERLKVPPIASVRELMRAALEIEKSEEKHVFPDKRWLFQLLHPGTSLGGARPKASVRDEDGTLLMAKFPSRKDDYDVALWEHFCHIKARDAGINVAETSTILGEDYHILLSKRFDRTDEGKRVHFASALTLLGLTDGDNASTGKGYIDIVDFMLRYGVDVDRNLEELYRRVAFNIIIGNTDDHFRNHGFLLTKRGWKLSPAYDMNPTLSEYQSLLINRNTSESNLEVLLSSSDDYMIPRGRAEMIITEVQSAMDGWQSDALKIGLPQRDIDIFASRINRWI